MHLRSRLLPLLALAAAALLLIDDRTRAYVLTGDSLGFDQRDVRVFDNFTDPPANANTTPDLSFPGYTGAELAIWKACVEWGSELHLEGQGDPHQPGDLGSGGGNFDFSWQGNATDVGGTDDNVHSELSGNGQGVYAFTEVPSSDGWRIRYYSGPWIWRDNPIGGATAMNHADLQGVACHELGHALGLAHSNDPAATMFFAPPNDETFLRSLDPDDVAGLQAIYGARSATKPHVDTYELLGGGALLVRGSAFDASDNEVWFTQAAAGGDGTPVKSSGLASTNGGTEIALALPAGAGPGDLLVKVPGTAHDALSNAFPFDPASEPCFLPKLYGTGKLTSAGTTADIGWTGASSLSTNDFKITLFGAPAGELAILFWGLAPQDRPFHGSRLLVARPLKRGPSVTMSPLTFAQVAIPIDASLLGVTRYYQFWFEDAGDPFGVGTSNALRVTFCP